MLASGDLVLPPGRGLPAGLTIPAAELVERFSRSSGPGGQGVNTTDSRVELRFDVGRSSALTELQRHRVLAQLAPRLVDGVLSIAASEHRSCARRWHRRHRPGAPPGRRAEPGSAAST